MSYGLEKRESLGEGARGLVAQASSLWKPQTPSPNPFQGWWGGPLCPPHRLAGTAARPTAGWQGGGMADTAAKAPPLAG